MRSTIALVSLAAFSLALGGCDRQSGQGAQAEGNAAANAADAATSGEVAPDEVTSGEVTSGEVASSGDAGGDAEFKHIVDRSHKGEAMPDKRFTGPDGKPVTLAKVAGGKPMLVNLWATWCAPCVAELPAIDAMAAQAAGKGVKVIAVSQDQTGADQVDPFWKARNLKTLQRYLDPENELGFHYKTGTLPTTILYDGKGKEVVRIVGALEWGGADGKALIGEIGG